MAIMGLVPDHSNFRNKPYHGILSGQQFSRQISSLGKQCSATALPDHHHSEQEQELCSRKILSAGLMTALYCNEVLQLQTCFT